MSGAFDGGAFDSGAFDAEAGSYAGAEFAVTVTLTEGGAAASSTGVGTALDVTVALSPGDYSVTQSAAGASFDVTVTLSPGGYRLYRAGASLDVSVTLVPGGARVVLPGASLGVAVALSPGGATTGTTVMPGAVLGVAVGLLAGAYGLSAVRPGTALNVTVELTTADYAQSAEVTIQPAELLLSFTGGFAVVEVPVYETAYEDWNVIKGTARRVVHDVFAVAAIYEPQDQPATSYGVRVRWHVRGNRLMGDLQGQGFAEVIAAVDRIVLNLEQLATIPLTPKRGDKISIPELNNEKFMLDVVSPGDGPVTQTWEVIRA
jgi:hypothetical protein